MTVLLVVATGKLIESEIDKSTVIPASRNARDPAVGGFGCGLDGPKTTYRQTPANRYAGETEVLGFRL